jgi:hypothetical protein
MPCEGFKLQTQCKRHEQTRACERIESFCLSGRSTGADFAFEGKLYVASPVDTRPFMLGSCGVCRIVGWPEALCTRRRALSQPRASAEVPSPTASEQLGTKPRARGRPA